MAKIVYLACFVCYNRITGTNQTAHGRLVLEGAMLKARFLGQFFVTAGDDVVEIPSRPAQSLFAYLILNAGVPQRRERLSGLFWPDSTVENARSNLRHALWRVRKALNACPACPRDIVLADDFTICFDATADYWLDTAVLENLGKEAAAADTLLQNVSVYCGELLPGFYDTWVLLERERLQAIFERKMGLLLQHLLAEQRWQEILQQGEHWIGFGQTPEGAYSALMVAHSALGNASQMAAVYLRCRNDLQEELGVKPAPQTRELFDQLSKGIHPRFGRPLLHKEEGIENKAQEMTEANKRLRRWTAGLVFLLLLAVVSAFLIVQQLALARHQARLSQGRELAAVAVNQLQSDPERGLLLALAAMNLTGGLNEPVLPEVASAFRQALQSMRILLTVPGTGGVAYSPDGRTIATTDLDHKAKI